MSTSEAKPRKVRILNHKLLPIAAVLLIVLALLFMATPLLRQSRGFQGSGTPIRQGDGQALPQNGFPVQGDGSQGQQVFTQGEGPQGFSDQAGPQGQVLSGQDGTNFPNQRLLFGIGLLSGRNAPIVFFITLLVSLAAALGMFFTKRWGQVLGIFMAVLYLLAGLVSLLPILLMSSLGLRNPMNLILGILQVLLAVAVIVLALFPAKKVTPLSASDLTTVAGG